VGKFMVQKQLTENSKNYENKVKSCNTVRCVFSAVVGRAVGDILEERMLMSFITQFATRPLTRFFGAIAVSTSLLLVGCGGGEVGVGIDATVTVPPPVQVAAFDVTMAVNGQQLRNLSVLPGQVQDVAIFAGDNFDLATSGPVAWTVVVGGSVIDAPAGSSIFYGNATIVPTLITNARYAASTGQQGFMPNPVVMTLIATSLNDSRQEAQINVVLNN
jgi:hypothetical protein